MTGCCTEADLIIEESKSY